VQLVTGAYETIPRHQEVQGTTCTKDFKESKRLISSNQPTFSTHSTTLICNFPNTP
jgi:hypothetical protein